MVNYRASQTVLLYLVVTQTMCAKIHVFLLVVFGVFVAVTIGRPDSAGHYPDLAPGISHGGIPYGSMSGNVAEYYKGRAASVGRSSNYYEDPIAQAPNFAPIEQWL